MIVLELLMEVLSAVIGGVLYFIAGVLMALGMGVGEVAKTLLND